MIAIWWATGGGYFWPGWILLGTGIALVLDFLTFNTESGQDLVKVYDGSSNAAPLVGTYSGNSLPAQINTTGGALFIEFQTNGSTTKAGWSAHFATHYCFPTSTLTATSGTFDDGSATSRNNPGNSPIQKIITTSGMRAAISGHEISRISPVISLVFPSIARWYIQSM